MLNFLSFFKQHNPAINIEPMTKNKGEHFNLLQTSSTQVNLV